MFTTVGVTCLASGLDETQPGIRGQMKGSTRGFQYSNVWPSTDDILVHTARFACNGKSPCKGRKWSKESGHPHRRPWIVSRRWSCCLVHSNWRVGTPMTLLHRLLKLLWSLALLFKSVEWGEHWAHNSCPGKNLKEKIEAILVRLVYTKVRLARHLFPSQVNSHWY